MTEYSKRVVFTMGGKGGVGKTGVIVALAEWFAANEIPVTLLDLDTENKARGSPRRAGGANPTTYSSRWAVSHRNYRSSPLMRLNGYLHEQDRRAYQRSLRWACWDRRGVDSRGRSIRRQDAVGFPRWPSLHKPAVNADSTWYGRIREVAEFGGEENLISSARDCASNQYLVGVWAASVRSIDESDPKIQCSMDHCYRFRVIAAGVGSAHSHTAKFDRRNGGFILAKCAGNHMKAHPLLRTKSGVWCIVVC